MASTPTSRLKKSKKGKKKKQEPYRPLAPSFETPKQFNKAVNQRAKTQYQPLIQETKRLTRKRSAKALVVRRISRVGPTTMGTPSMTPSMTPGARSTTSWSRATLQTKQELIPCLQLYALRSPLLTSEPSR